MSISQNYPVNHWLRGVPTIVALTVALLGGPDTYAEQIDTLMPALAPEPYTVEASLSAGPAISFFKYPRTPISPGGVVPGISTMLRVMWHPGRLLSFGIAFGYTIFSREDFTPVQPFLRTESIVPGRVIMYGFPLQAAVSMQKGGLDLGLGMGPYLMTVDLFDSEDHTRSSRMELGVTLFASYDWPLGRGFVAGPSLRCIMLAYRGVTTLVPEYRVRYDVLSY